VIVCEAVLLRDLERTRARIAQNQRPFSRNPIGAGIENFFDLSLAKKNPTLKAGDSFFWRKFKRRPPQPVKYAKKSLQKGTIQQPRLKESPSMSCEDSLQ
jgi:hypothetical protein